MNTEEALGLILTSASAAGSLTTCDGGGTTATVADTRVEAITAAGDAKTEGDAAAGITGTNSGEKKTLRVAVRCMYAPYNWTQPDDSSGAVTIADSSEFVYGYDAMVAEKIHEELGYDLEIVCLDWGSLVPAVTAGRVNRATAGQSIAPEYLQAADFTEPYYHVTTVTLVKEGGRYTDARSVVDLAGATCTSQQSTIWYNTCLPQIQDASVLAAIVSAPGMFMSLSVDKCDLVVADQPIGKGVLIAYPNFKMIEFGGGDVDFQVADEDINIGIFLKKENTELKDAVNSVPTKMTKDGFSRMMDGVISVQSLAN